jgi:transposase
MARGNDLRTLRTTMFHLCSNSRDRFLSHYHMRNNAESTLMAIKAEFGAAIQSRTRVAQENEILGKVVCHTICAVIQSIYELGIQPQFGLI